MEYEGSASGPVNGAVIDGNGYGAIDISVGGVLGALGNAALAALNAIVPTANASSTSLMAYGQLAGWTSIPGLPFGSLLGPSLIAVGGYIDASGVIYGSNGLQIGRIDLGVARRGDQITIGPVNADVLMSTISTATPYGDYDTAGIEYPISSVLQGLVDSRGTRLPFRPVMRTWAWTTDSTDGVPVLDWQNTMNLFTTPPTRAFLHPRFIGGRGDGIYDLCSGMRVVPPAEVGPAPKGFGLGPRWATYQPTTLGIGWTAKTKVFMWAPYVDRWNVIDPDTGTFPVLVAWFQVRVWDGSQQVSTFGYPQWDYPAGPSTLEPQYNSASGGIIALSNAVTNPAIQGYVPGTNQGGPDGAGVQ